MHKYLYLLFSVFLLSGCDWLLLRDETPATPTATFEYLWQRCHEQYAFFEYKQVNWQEVYHRYAPLVHDDMSQDSLFAVLFDMLLELRDGHVNLISPFNISRFEIGLLGPQQIDERVVLENYLGRDYYITGPFRHTFLAADSVGYIRYSSFSNTVSDFDLNFIIGRYWRTQGLILDLRQNGGGNAENIFTILNRFTSQKALLYQSYLKNGPGAEDFSPPQPAYAVPPDSKDLLRYSRKVIVLTDRGTFSAASFFALASKAIPRMQIMGDTTGGGLGIPNGGQLPNGWTYRISISRTLSPEGDNYENGVPPDLYLSLDQQARSRGVDNLIEAAIQEILK
ncbi:MAG: S41 family peptidase [Haliscomenobacter sp.]